MPITPAQRAQRRSAGKRSGQVRGRREDQDNTSGDPSAPMPVTNDPDVDAQLEAYDLRVGAPQSWPDVKNREQVRGEILRNKAAARADRIESGAALTREQVRARDERLAAAVKAGLSNVSQLLTDHVPPDRLLDAQKAARLWVEKTLTDVAAVVEGAR